MTHSEFTWKSNSTEETIFAQTWQPDTKPKAIVALVHGLGEHSGRYAHVAAYFNANNIGMSALDLYGHGKSGGKRGHIPQYEQHLDVIAEFLLHIQHQHPNVPVFLYGHSMGGNLVLNYLLRHKPLHLAGVIVTGPAIKPGFEPPKLLVALGRLTRKLIPSFTQGNQLDVDGIARDKAVVQAYLNDPLVHDRLSSELGIGILESGKWLYDNTHNTSVPLLMMHGTQDRLTSPEATKHFFAHIKGNTTLKLWEGLYHELHNEPEQREVLAYITAWIETKCVVK